MEHYVTLFNSLYLPQGLTLYSSMEKYIKNYLLWIICVDDVTFEVLHKLQLKNIKLIKLSEVESEVMLNLRSTRTIGEYCWTLTPFAPKIIFDADHNINRVTYIDADLWFLKNPRAIFEEFEASGKAVLITDHCYAPEYDQSHTSGQYCVQFIIFVRQKSESVRKWWQDKCVEWCYARYEDGKFGDQKYLDDWPKLFSSDVHVLGGKDLALGTWNAIRFPYSTAIFYHFHGLKIISYKKVQLGAYKLPALLIENVYKPYLNDLKKSLAMYINLGYDFQPRQKKIVFLKLCVGQS